MEEENGVVVVYLQLHLPLDDTTCTGTLDCIMALMIFPSTFIFIDIPMNSICPPLTQQSINIHTLRLSTMATTSTLNEEAENF